MGYGAVCAQASANHLCDEMDELDKVLEEGNIKVMVEWWREHVHNTDVHHLLDVLMDVEPPESD